MVKFAEPKDVKMKAAEDLFDAPAEVQPEPGPALAPESWAVLPPPSSAYPYDGQPVVLKMTDKDVVEAVWRRSREWSPIYGRFVPVNFWALRPGNFRLSISPIAWMKHAEAKT